MSSPPPPTWIAAAIAIIARARVRKRRRVAALGPLGADDACALAAAITRTVEIARAGRGMSVPAKWERERLATQLVALLRQGKVDALRSTASQLTDFDLALLDLGLLNAARVRGWVDDPERGAREIEGAIQQLRRAGYYGQIIQDDGTQATNRSGRQTDHARLGVIIDAMGIFKTFTGSTVKSSPKSPGARFVAAVLELSGHPTSGLPQAIAHAIAVTTLSDLDLERRQGGA